MDFTLLIVGADTNAYYMARCYHELTNKKAYILAKNPIWFTDNSKIIIPTYNDNLREEKTFLEEQIRSKDQQIEAAFKQISEKDKQIEEKDKQIKELLNRLTQSMDLTKGLQYITAADKTTQMLQANGGAVQWQDQEQQQEPQEQEVQTAVKIQDQAEPQQKKKKNNLLHRLFNKS